MRDLPNVHYLSRMCGPLHPLICVDTATHKSAIEEYRRTNKKRYQNGEPSHHANKTNTTTRQISNISSVSKTKEDKEINTDINSVGVIISITYKNNSRRS
jgi:hypothetical protein